MKAWLRTRIRRLFSRIHPQCVSLISGLVLTFAAALVLANDTREEPRRLRAPATTQPQPWFRVAQLTSSMRPVVIIVSSEEHATWLGNAIRDDRVDLPGGEMTVPQVSFLVVADQDHEYLIEAVYADQMGSDTFDIVDLRR